LDEETGEFL
nr:Chain B, Nuclear factor erythroid 2 related factor 2 [synthetic construct]5WFV_P Chain P, Nrf2 ETGE peptide [Homo sapiens]